MTQLMKMQISGVRLFDPNEPQCIKFCPLTLILGVNGAGKTTIIESLRYATSGETPPGSSGGKLWITDAGLCNYGNQIRAQVKLKFRATDGVMTQITRCMELNTKRSREGKVTQQFKTLDSTLTRFGPDGGKLSTLSSRCAEIDKEMLITAGVSKAVLTNVIFCHQEDNCWPMSEGKVLKEKFDQIFGSVGYVKALAKVKAYRTKKVAELKALEAVRDKFAEIREQKETYEKDKARHVREMDHMRQEKNNLESKLKPIEQELTSLSQDESSVAEVRSKVAKLKGQRQEKLKSVDDLEKQVKEKFTGTLADLDQKECEFRAASSLTGKTDVLTAKETRIKELDSELKTSNNRLGALLIQKGRIEQQEESFRRDLTSRNDFVNKLMQDPDTDVDNQMNVDGDENGEDQKYLLLVSLLEAKVALMTQDSESTERESEAEIRKLSDQVEGLKIAKAQAQQTIKLKEETQHKRESEMKELLVKVNQVEATAGIVVEHSDEILAAVSELKSKLQDDSDASEVETKASGLKLTQCQLQEEIMELKKMNNQLVRECLSSVTEIRKEVKKLEQELSELQETLRSKKEQNRSYKSSVSVQLGKRKDWIRELKSLHSNVAKHSDTGDKAAKFKTQIDQLSAEIQQIRAEKETLETEVSAIQKEVSESEIVLRNFSDNRRLLTLMDEIAAVNEIVIQEEKKMPLLDIAALERKKQDLNRKAEHIREQIGSVKGRMQMTQQESRQLDSQLQSAKYKDISRSYKQAMVDLVTQEILVDDLNKYYKVLDQAVSKYHIRRMEQINQLIGHYWRTTYQGADIKTIRIECDGDEERSADKRRSFNYRVVMVKKDTEMDMRGRCSAGQKVLASLVIRIALAQVFCVNCSILTLDEPTTNLDKANVGALARAICSIVTEQKGKIQMVIITHDAEFLQYLNEEFSEFYYEVCKDDVTGFSHIKRSFLRDRE